LIVERLSYQPTQLTANEPPVSNKFQTDISRKVTTLEPDPLLLKSLRESNLQLQQLSSTSQPTRKYKYCHPTTSSERFPPKHDIMINYGGQSDPRGGGVMATADVFERKAM
jgi:hypothetical protein